MATHDSADACRSLLDPKERHGAALSEEVSFQIGRFQSRNEGEVLLRKDLRDKFRGTQLRRVTLVRQPPVYSIRQMSRSRFRSDPPEYQHEKDYGAEQRTGGPDHEPTTFAR